MNFKSFVAGVLFLFSSSIASQSAFYHIEQQNSESIVIDFDFPKPEVVESQSNPSLVSVDIPGLPLNYAEGQPLIPVFSSSLVVPEGNVSWTLLSAETETIKNARPVLYYSGDNSAADNGPRDYAAYLFPS
ncbi:MAG: hypothetical protein P8184_21265, partial [Calditrichia bacterium]